MAKTQVRYYFHLKSDFAYSIINIWFAAIGPGTYAQEKVKVVGTVKDMMSNSFSTKVRSQNSLNCRDQLYLLLVWFLMIDSSFLPDCTRLEHLQAAHLLEQSGPRLPRYQSQVYGARVRLGPVPQQIPLQ